ncbi:MAG: hypothetical protein GY926_05320 [bacterium]|nr:hypothetical protein [bacterium]MCP4964634.1 hypothetical protein [bacterium]
MPETVSMSIELDETAKGVNATGRFELSGKTYRASAHAPENHRDHRIAHDLAVARVMRNLELELMEWIHEHIDRYIADE